MKYTIVLLLSVLLFACNSENSDKTSSSETGVQASQENNQTNSSNNDPASIEMRKSREKLLASEGSEPGEDNPLKGLKICSFISDKSAQDLTLCQGSVRRRMEARNEGYNCYYNCDNPRSISTIVFRYLEDTRLSGNLKSRNGSSQYNAFQVKGADFAHITTKKTKAFVVKGNYEIAFILSKANKAANKDIASIAESIVAKLP